METEALTKCEHFCNARCSFDCPNAAIEAWEDRFDLDAKRELGIERVKCRNCRYANKRCTCDDCYFKGGKECPKKEEIRNGQSGNPAASG